MVIFTINEQFDEAEKTILINGKKKFQDKLKLKKLTWRKYFLLLASERR